MGIDLTRQNFTLALFSFVLVFILTWFRELSGIEFDMVISDHTAGIMPLGNTISSLIESDKTLYVSVSIFLLFINSFYLSRIFIKKVVYSPRNHLPAVLYLLFCSVIDSTRIMPIIQLSTLLSILSIENIISIDKDKRCAGQIFSASVLVGIATLIYLPSVCFFIIVFLGQFFFSKIGIKGLFISIFGYILPIFFYSYYYWIRFEYFTIFLSDVWTTLDPIYLVFPFDILKMPIPYLSFAIVLSYSIVNSLLYVMTNSTYTRAKAIFAYMLFFMLFCILVGAIIVCGTLFFTIIPFMAVAISILISYLLTQSSNRSYSNILLLLIIISALLACYYDVIVP